MRHLAPGHRAGTLQSGTRLCIGRYRDDGKHRKPTEMLTFELPRLVPVRLRAVAV